MSACDEIRASLAIAEDAVRDPTTRNAAHIRDLSEPLQSGVGKGDQGRG